MKKPIIGIVGLLVLGGLAWLAFGFFGIQSAFIDETVEEDGPIFTATAAEQDEVAATDEFQEAMVESEKEATESNDEMPDMPEAEVVTVYSGSFSGESRYNIVGTANVLNDGSPQRFLRFEGFESDNGPDLKVYLRAADGTFESLGALKGNVGSQNYEIPTSVDLEKFSTVEIWCERFGVGFGSAQLAAA